MEVSDVQWPEGWALVLALAQMTGLPEQVAQTELLQVLKWAGKDPSQLTVESLRRALMSYLESLDQSH